MRGRLAPCCKAWTFESNNHKLLKHLSHFVCPRRHVRSYVCWDRGKYYMGAQASAQYPSPLGLLLTLGSTASERFTSSGTLVCVRRHWQGSTLDAYAHRVRRSLSNGRVLRRVPGLRRRCDWPVSVTIIACIALSRVCRLREAVRCTSSRPVPTEREEAST